MRDHLSLYFYRRRNEAGSRLLSRSENVRNSSRARRTSTGEYPYTSENFSTFRFCIIIIYFSLSLLLAKILFISFFWTCDYISAYIWNVLYITTMGLLLEEIAKQLYEIIYRNLYSTKHDTTNNELYRGFSKRTYKLLHSWHSLLRAFVFMTTV